MPAPYVVDFLNEFGKKVELYAFFEMDKSDSRDDKWQKYCFENFTGIFMKGKRKNEESAYCKDIIKYYKDNKIDFAIITNYASLTGIKLAFYLKRKKIKYIICGDGAFCKKESFIKKIIKKKIFSGASKIFYTSDEHLKYFLSGGAERNKCFKIPFGSIYNNEIIKSPFSFEEKARLKKELNLPQGDLVISVGRFIPLKDFATLLRAFSSSALSASLLIIGGKPTGEYESIITEQDIKNVYFLDFMSPAILYKYYKAADLFVFTSLSDVWGLVVNEAASFGLPIICSTGALAGFEFSYHNNGTVMYEKGNSDALKVEMINFFNKTNNEREHLGQLNIDRAKNYTIEKIASRFYELIIKEEK